MRGFFCTLVLVGMVGCGGNAQHGGVDEFSSVEEQLVAREGVVKVAREDRYLVAAREGGAYLARMCEGNGRFVYEYDPRRDRENVVPYNMLRHAGAIYAMSELYGVTGDEELLAAVERGIGYMKGAIRGVGEDGAVMLDRMEKIKLGGNALAVVALAEHAKVTGSRENVELMQRLARWMISTQNPAGEFEMHIVDADSGEVGDHVSDYYPGEAILALLRLHDLDVDERWLDAAEKSARWLIVVRDAGKGLGELPHDHWLLYGLNELQRKRPSLLWVDHASKLCAAIEGAQIGAGVERAEWVGGWGIPPRTTPASTRVEGLIAGARLLGDFGREEEARAARESAMRGIDFFLQMQHGMGDSFVAPWRAVGGFGESLTDADVRIDFVQHAISALLGARRVGETTR